MHRFGQDLRFRARRLMKQPVFILIAVSTLALSAGFTQIKTTTIRLDNPNEMQPRNVKTEQVTYKGRKALRVADAAPPNVADGIQLVILNKTELQDGVIEVELTGEPAATAGGGARGFVGVAFRVNLDAAKNAAVALAHRKLTLHHVPSPALQDRLLAEVYRVLRPGGVFSGSDSRWSLGFHMIHLWDTMVVVEPETFAARLEAAGFTDVSVEVAKRAFRFRARHP